MTSAAASLSELLTRTEAERDDARRQLDTLRNAESVGVSYCTLHHGIANEDENDCDMRDYGDEVGPDGEPLECVLVELIQRPALAAVGDPEAGRDD